MTELKIVPAANNSVNLEIWQHVQPPGEYGYEKLLGRLEIQVHGRAVVITNGSLTSDLKTLEKVQVDVGKHEFVSRQLDDGSLRFRASAVTLQFQVGDEKK